VENMIWSQRRRRRRRQEEEEEEEEAMMMMMMVTRHPSTSRGSGEREFQVGFTTGMQITAAIACENTSTRVEFRFPTPTKFLDQGFGGGHRGRRRVPRRHKGPDLGRDSEPRVPPSCSLSSFTFPCHLAHPQPAFSTLLVLLLLLFPLPHSSLNVVVVVAIEKPIVMTSSASQQHMVVQQMLRVV
jgi:hypothetical protein